MHSYILYDIQTGEKVTKSVNKLYKSASIVKVAIIIGAFYAENKRKTKWNSEDYFLFEKMIKESDNTAASYLWMKLGSEEYFDEFFKAIGCENTVSGEDGFWGLTTTNVEDQLKVVRLLVEENAFIHEKQRQYILSLLSTVRKEQRFGYESFEETNYHAFIKNGWSPKEEENWRINSIGIVKSKEKTYALCVLSEGNATFEEGKKELRRIVTELKKFLK